LCITVLYIFILHISLYSTQRGCRTLKNTHKTDLIIPPKKVFLKKTFEHWNQRQQCSRILGETATLRASSLVFLITSVRTYVYCIRRGK